MVVAAQETKAGDSSKPVSSRPVWQRKENLLVSSGVGSGVGTAGKWWDPRFVTCLLWQSGHQA